jgi:hypothetical protein
MIAPLPHTMRELHSRSADGIHVRLLWNKHDGRVIVAVADTKAGDRFTVEVRYRGRALDVFHHPYAYAAWRGVEDLQAEGERVTAQLRAA